MNNGWIKLYRQFLEWEWYDDKNVKILFIHCLLKANHTEKKWRGNLIKRGSFITSLSNLASETGLSVRQVRTCLEKLESTGEIDKVTTSLNTCVSISNYDDYQKIDKVTTIDRQTDDKRATTTKNEKNVKNEKKYIPDLPDVVEYFKENGYSESAAEKAYYYYQESVNGSQRKFWRDSKGNMIKNWKMKMRAVWFKDENKMNGDNFDPEKAKAIRGAFRES